MKKFFLFSLALPGDAIDGGMLEDFQNGEAVLALRQRGTFPSAGLCGIFRHYTDSVAILIERLWFEFLLLRPLSLWIPHDVFTLVSHIRLPE